MLPVCLYAQFGLIANNNYKFFVMGDLKKDMKIKSFDYASDISKQLILLSSSIFTITITFREYIFGKDVTISAHGLLLYVWILFIISILFGIITLRALAGTLNRLSKDGNDEASIYDCNIRTPALCQSFTFLLALVFAIISVF